ncbi:MAG: nucleotide exchange factor GrpE [Peptostreptococcaceae bacterium]|nr:nucleotide exchange factor GrpE [Peptostreptococcaceae bacterium]
MTGSEMEKEKEEMRREEVQEEKLTGEKDEKPEEIPAEKEECESEKLRKELEEMKHLAQRTQADFMNYKKRVDKEKKELSALANERIMEELLEVLDNFERALSTETEDLEGFRQGVEMILKQLKDKLGKFGLAEIEALGADFDPNFHHAVMQVEGEEPDKVVEVLQKGYVLKEKVIRPSMVQVSK